MYVKTLCESNFQFVREKIPFALRNKCLTSSIDTLVLCGTWKFKSSIFAKYPRLDEIVGIILLYYIMLG